MDAYSQNMQFRILELIVLQAWKPYSIFQIAYSGACLGVQRWGSIDGYRRFGAICCLRHHLIQFWYVAVFSKQFGPCHIFKALCNCCDLLHSLKFHRGLQREIKNHRQLLNMFSIRNRKLLYLFLRNAVIFNHNDIKVGIILQRNFFAPFM